MNDNIENNNIVNDNIVNVNLHGKEIKLIGTAHISRNSIDEVRNIITEEKPDIICVELDKGRYNSITQKDNWENLNLTKVFKEGKGFLLIANLVMASFQRRLGNELGVKPGEEMKTAIETAESQNIPYSFCDREVQITLRRAWAKCSFWSKNKLLASLLASAFTTEKMDAKEIENLKNKNELDGMMNELSGYLPEVKETLIDERDHYLAANIWTACTNKKKIIAVIGAGHIQGIINHLEKLAAGEMTTNVDALNQIPPRSKIAMAVPYLIPLALIGLLAAGFFLSGVEKSAAMLLQWVLWNGSLSALGAAIALAHPFAIIISFLGAPLTSLTPVVGVGLLSGLVQITFHKPRVADMQNLSGDVTGIKSIYRNRITRALLVFFLSSLGSSIGTFVSFPNIAALLTK